MDTEGIGSFGEGPEISDQEMDRALQQVHDGASARRTRNLGIAAASVAVVVLALGGLVAVNASKSSDNHDAVAAATTSTSVSTTTSTTIPRTTTTIPPVASVSTQTLTGKSSQQQIPWTFKFPQVKGLKTAAIDQRVNKAIRDQFTTNVGQLDQGDYGTEEYDSPKPTNYYVGSAVKRNDAKIVSVEFDVVQDFEGEAHPIASTYSMTFNAQTGNPIDLKDIFSNEQGALNAASIYVKSILSQHKNDSWCVSEVGSADPNEYAYSIFFPEKDGFHVLFDYDTVACHAGGTREITVPWSNLDSYLSDYGNTITN